MLNLRILVIGHLQNKDMIGDTWSSTKSTSNMILSLHIVPSTNQGYTNQMSLEYYCGPM